MKRLKDEIIFPGKEINKDELFKEALYQLLMTKKFEKKYEDAFIIAKTHRKRSVELIDIIADNNYSDEFLKYCFENKERMGIKIG